MVLINEVCTDCNQGLGKELDEILARDSFESLIRAQKLSLRRGKKDRFKARRIVIQIPDERKFGHYRGARMAVSWQTRKLRPLDQIIVRDENGNLHSFTEKEIGGADERLFRKLTAWLCAGDWQSSRCKNFDRTRHFKGSAFC